MTDYTSVGDSEIDPDAPLTSWLGYRFRDNPLAMFEGAAGAPRLRYAAYPDHSAGDLVLEYPNGFIGEVETDVYSPGSPSSIELTKVLFRPMKAGGLRLKFSTRRSSGVAAMSWELRKNGTTIWSSGSIISGTYVELTTDFTFAAHDKIALVLLQSGTTTTGVTSQSYDIRLCSKIQGPYRF